MKRYFPWIILALAGLWLASNCSMPKAKPGEFDLATFGKLPVLVGGRQKPIDTVARNTLVIIHGRQTLRVPGAKTVEATQWLADTLFNPVVADKYQVFVINNPDVLGLFGWKQDERKFFSFTELSPFLKKIDSEGQKVEEVESAKRTPYQTAINNLRNSMIIYQRLKNSLQPEDAQDFASEIDAYVQIVPIGLEEAQKRMKTGKFDKAKLDGMLEFTSRYATLGETAYMLPIPPDLGSAGRDAKGGKINDWVSMGAGLLRVASVGTLNPVVKAYALIGDAYRKGNTALFNQQAQDLLGWMKTNEPRATGRAAFELLFNQFAPFYQAMGLYVLAFLLVCASWLCSGDWSRTCSKAAFYLLLLTLVVHTFGLGSRMYLQGRPPVTKVYSSAIFIGWGTVIIGLILERIFKDGIGAASAAAIGFITLIIAHHLAGSGDTLEMLQAVLDTNIWLATHVVSITIGYSAMFFAGMLAIIYVLRTLFGSMSKQAADSLTRMVYGVVCFATLFSFVGTVLGGIWADQSWGRFWGWDPKENGALLIVLWCAVILHARWGGYIRQRGLMAMALVGNIITSFSWFGVNMLGVGLHSYGFMNKAVPWLAGFIIFNLLLIGICILPRQRAGTLKAA